MSRELPARARLAALTPRRRRALGARSRLLLEAVGRPVSRPALGALLSALEALDESELWLALAVLHAELPTPSQVRRLRRSRELDGGWGALDQLLEDAPRRRGERGAPVPVRVVSDVVLMDVTGLLPGDSVAPGLGAARQLARAWSREAGILPVAWGGSRRRLRELEDEERRAIGLAAPAGRLLGATETALVPHRAAYLLVGAVQLPRSAERIIALGESSANRSGSVGYGLGPLLRAEEHPPQKGEARFSWHLAAQRSLERLVVLGDGDTREYEGWRRMLSAVGRPGPELHGFALPADAAGVAGSITAPGSSAAWLALAGDAGAVLGLAGGRTAAAP
ncbi:hypothetical protein [Homoserinibacter sp. YIM 151385]|uniref:hypothetical protein n=1 Tax=Homoserinibacter sp. YIM 151385 TaxID=2985506 RepID=UPI0022F07E81|nr:hypothetical protein [Homoserinibacter sp. YIM 151385]WBU37777.1 hypothetical protein OF852_12785 [Homoserinibacter sp. YIM 151385]